MNRELARRILNQLGIVAPDQEMLVTSLSRTIERRCCHPIHPKSGESLAFSIMRPKTAALAFDKVYRIPVMQEPLPEEIGFYGASQGEIAYWSYALAALAAQSVGVDIDLFKDSRNEEIKSGAERENLRFLSDEITNVIGVAPTLIYEHTTNQTREFPRGKTEILMAAIADIKLVEESELSWEQVMEFRRDSDARIKYRRLVRWLDNELQSKPAEEVQELIAFRLDDYEWAIKKHGFKAALGSMSCLIDPKFLGAASAGVIAATLAGGGNWAALTAMMLVVGRALITFGTTYIDGIADRRASNYEIAYVHEIRKRLG